MGTWWAPSIRARLSKRRSGDPSNYNYFRDYDPAIGRYVESDPIGLGGGLNTYAYVGGDPLAAFDRLGLLIGFINCSKSQRSDIERAEQQLRDFFKKHFACPKGEKCIQREMADLILQKLETNKVECSDFDRITSIGIWGASAVPGSDSITFRPNSWASPKSYGCFAATMLHETMHTLGLTHDFSPWDVNDVIYGPEIKCMDAGLCKGGGP